MYKRPHHIHPQMYEEYVKAYRHYSVTYGADTAIFYQVGKFYELYDWIDPKTGQAQTSMRRAMEILGTQMSERKGDAPGGLTGLFGGVPDQNLHKYASLLTRKNWTVVVINQVKDAKGNVAERTMSRILTPGTHIESITTDVLYTSAIWLEDSAWGSNEPPSFALASIDLSTGRIYTYEGTATGRQGAWTADDAFHYFQVYPPRECVVYWRGDSIARPTAATLGRQFGLYGVSVSVQQADAKAQGGLEKALVRESLFKRSIPVRSLLPTMQALNIQEGSKTERCLASLLHRVHEVFPQGPTKLFPPLVWQPSASLSLGNHALIQLNMVTPQIEDSILGLYLKTQTKMGRRAMRSRILYPIADPAALDTRYNEIALMDTRHSSTEQYLRAIDDLPRLHRRISAGETSPAEIIALDTSYRAMHAMQSVFADTLLAQQGWTAPKLQNTLQSVFSVEKAIAMKSADDMYCFQTGVAPAVDAVEADIAAIHGKFQGCLETVRQWAGLPPEALRLEFRETMAPFITGKKAAFDAIRTRLKDATRPFPGMELAAKKGSAMEIPYLESLFRELQVARAKLQEEIRRALPGLCDTVAEASLGQWDLAEEWVSLIDVSYTIWKVSKDLGFVRPTVVPGDTGSVQIEGLRHPLIEAAMTRVEYVAHDVCLGDGETGWLVYGMNASGKSSLMKAVGIAVILAQAGCHVPARSMTFSPFQSLFTRILNTDNLWSGLSSFAVEMTELREIVARAGPRSLVLGDELCSGTESVSATALVGASLQYLHDRNVRFIFATHLHGLTPLIQGLKAMKVWHLKVLYDRAADRLVYERTLTPGAGSSLYGLEVARAMNLPADLIESAMAIRRTLLGTATDVDAPLSEWNGSVQRRQCERCEAQITGALEVHHIEEQNVADAETGRLPSGQHKDHPRNLIVVCGKCHDLHHAGKITIHPVKQTSDGPVRIIEEAVAEPKQESRRSSKWNSDQIRIIESYLVKYPMCPPKRIVFDLREKEGIQISVAALKGFRH